MKVMTGMKTSLAACDCYAIYVHLGNSGIINYPSTKLVSPQCNGLHIGKGGVRSYIFATGKLWIDWCKTSLAMQSIPGTLTDGNVSTSYYRSAWNRNDEFQGVGSRTWVHEFCTVHSKISDHVRGSRLLTQVGHWNIVDSRRLWQGDDSESVKM